MRLTGSPLSRPVLRAGLLAGIALLALVSLSAQSRFQLTSPAFANNGPLPVAYTCHGERISAPLSWTGAPAGTRSFALILFDPDARPPQGFVHWVVYDLPPASTGIASGKHAAEELPGGGVSGENSAGRIGFTPSCPPPGPDHHYTFTLYALKVSSLGLAPGATRRQVLEAMRGKILGRARLVGLYGTGNGSR